MRNRLLTLAMAATLVVSGHAASADPLNTEAWIDLKAAYLGDGAVVYDQAVKVRMPRVIWEPWSVPVEITLGAELGVVSEIFLFAENNPIPVAVQILPRRAMRAVGMNIRLERTTPVRAAARGEDGVWHVANVEVVVMSPGGCSTPNLALAESEVGLIATKLFDRDDGSRLKVMINHPMDTGFASDKHGNPVPAYYIEAISIEDEAGPIADLVTWAALASDPSFTFDLPGTRQSVRVTARDSLGLVFDSAAPASSM